MSDIVKRGGLAKLSDEDMRRRNEDNAKATAEIAELAVIGDYAYYLYVPTYWRIDGERHPDPRTQAILRHNTTCTSCGQRIKAGDEIVITFATAPAEGTFRHADCEPTNG